MKRFIKDLKKYWKYIVYSTMAQLKNEVANSHLGWIWWVLEPLCFMLVYVFISSVVFKSSEQYFQVFVFIGLTLWTFFNKNIISSVKLINANRDTVTKIYLPKFVLLLINMGINFVKLLISLALVFIFMIILSVPFSIYILWIIPILIVLVIITFGISSIVMHLGVFAEDLHNIINIGFRLIFYLSGVFYALSKRIPSPYNDILLKVNPIALLINAARNVLIYSNMSHYIMLLIWFFIGVILCIIGVRTIYKYENTYVKVMN